MKRKVSFCTILVVLTVGGVPALAMPPDQATDWTSDKEIFVPMRDGVKLSTDVMLPKGVKQPLGTVLVRTPYDKDIIDWGYFGRWFEIFLKQGYALVLQNERGRHFSEGDYKHYLEGAATDGYDTVEWITKQPWSNGKVGTFGCSSSGEQQWPMANSHPPGLAAMLPLASGTAIGSIPGNDTQGAVYRGGVPLVGLWAWWYHDMATRERPLLPANTTQAERIRLRNSFSLMPRTWFYTINDDKIDLTNSKNDAEKLLMQLPSKDILRRLGGAMTPFDDFVTWTPGDPRWNEVPLARSPFSSHTPTLLVDTWHDIGVGEMARLFKHLEDQNTPDQFLIIGAGPHCSMLEGEEGKFERTNKVTGNPLAHLKFGDLDVGDARYRQEDDGYANLFLAWFDHFLRGNDNGVTKMPAVQLFVMGKGWMSANRWPLESTKFTKYYLDSRAAPRSSLTTGLLATSMPQGTKSDTYLYDPARPVPTRGGSCCSDAMAVDQRDVEMRRDVLSYSTPVLDHGITVVGPIQVVLYVSSSAKDTDFVVKLIDVYPDGKTINLADDGFRVRYREGFDKTVLMKPGEVYQIQLTNMVTGNYFPPGHRIQLDVTSSNFPAFERNLNTGGNNYDETTWVTAENGVHHSSDHASYVLLPVVSN